MGTLETELAPHVEALTGRPRIYADANVPAGVLSYMRERLGWDVLAVVEHDDLRRARDEEHYRVARQLRRTLVSLDRDFVDEARFPIADSGGVIVLSAPDERGLAKLLLKVDRAYFRSRGGGRGAETEGPLLGQKIEVHPDWSDPTRPPSRRRRKPRRR